MSDNKVVQIREKRVPSDHLSTAPASAAPLQTGGGGGTYEPMDVVDAKIAAAEARTDSKFAEMLGELRVISGRLDHIETTTNGLRLNTWLAMLSAVAIVIAVYAWGSQMFGVGMNADSIARQAAENAQSVTAAEIEALSRSYDRMETNFQELIRAVQGQASQSRSENSMPDSDGAEQQTAPDFVPLPFEN